MPIATFQQTSSPVFKDLESQLPPGSLNSVMVTLATGETIVIDVTSEGLPDAIEYMESKGFTLILVV